MYSPGNSEWEFARDTARNRLQLLIRGEDGKRWGVDLRKGAGEPTDESGVVFVRAHGEEALGEVAKLHFKNTAKVLRRSTR